MRASAVGARRRLLHLGDARSAARTGLKERERERSDSLLFFSFVKHFASSSGGKERKRSEQKEKVKKKRKRRVREKR